MLTSSIEVRADVDPNFHIYICFGQSNMEGNAQWESEDMGNVDPRFKMLATCNFSSPSRTLGYWYTATCPIVSPVGKLGPTDYFGRTMVANLPSDYKIGVVAVAMGGSPIEMFDKDKYQQKMNENPNEWWAQIARNYYGGNPYGRIIQMAQKAQEVGVIKGILLHQGCSNCGDPNWPNMVKKIYNDMLNDLGLNAEDVPLFVGEVEYKGSAPQSGGCESHNVQVDLIPSVIPTGHVVSAKYLPGNGVDPWHFSAEGYRILGKRYAQVALSVLYDIDIDVTEPEHPVTPMTVDERFTATNDIKSTPFAIVNETENKALYGRYDQRLGYGDYLTAFNDINTGYLFKLALASGGFRLKFLTPKGDTYPVVGGIGYLNSQGETGSCCMISGLNGQNGQFLSKGAVWDLQYVEGKGWAIKNVGTGKYLKDVTSPAIYDEPTYFTFCTLKEGTSGISETGIADSENRGAATGWFTLDGRKLKEKPAQRGLYIFNGKKVAIK